MGKIRPLFSVLQKNWALREIEVPLTGPLRPERARSPNEVRTSEGLNGAKFPRRGNFASPEGVPLSPD